MCVERIGYKRSEYRVLIRKSEKISPEIHRWKDNFKIDLGDYSRILDWILLAQE
jgi:hypothetical protein